MGFSFGSFWSAKYLNFGSESCENRILSRLIQETYTMRKIVKRDFTVSIEFRINSKRQRENVWPIHLASTIPTIKSRRTFKSLW